MTESETQLAESALRRFRGMEDNYGFVLVAILAALIIMGALSERPMGRTVTLLLFGVVFFLTLLASAVPRRWMLMALVLVPPILAVAALAGTSGNRSAVGNAAYIMSALLVITCAVVIARRIAKHPKISVRTVMGTVCIYLFAALLFALIYRTMDMMDGGPFFAQTNDPAGIDYIYFSFVSITTLGFGDLSPASDLGKITAVVEAIIGQLYLVTVVALFVGNIGRRWRDSLD